MNRFRFRLESVLRVRAAREEEKTRDFGVALGHLTQEEQRHRGIADAAADHDRLRAGRGTGPLSVGRQIRDYFYAQHLRRQGDAQEKRVRDAGAVADEKRADMVTAMRDRKTLERLKEKQHEAHEREAAREEQALIDETATQHSARTRESY